MSNHNVSRRLQQAARRRSKELGIKYTQALREVIQEQTKESNDDKTNA